MCYNEYLSFVNMNFLKRSYENKTLKVHIFFKFRWRDATATFSSVKFTSLTSSTAACGRFSSKKERWSRADETSGLLRPLVSVYPVYASFGRK